MSGTAVRQVTDGTSFWYNVVAMEPDPIAENQTDVTIATLMARKDGDLLMNQAIASALAYMKKLGSELQEVKASLWTPSSLDERIKSVHESECKDCPVRKWFDGQQQQQQQQRTTAPKPTLWSLLLSERGLLVIVVIIVTLAYARLTLGQQGYRDVTHPLAERIPK